MNNTTEGDKFFWIMSDGSIGSLPSRWLQNSDKTGTNHWFQIFTTHKIWTIRNIKNEPASLAPISGQDQRDQLFFLAGKNLPPTWAIMNRRNHINLAYRTTC